MDESYALILNNQEFYIPRDFEILMKFPKAISSQLVSKQKYLVESNVSNEIFQKYVDYIKDNSKIPIINSDNLYEYHLLSKEFNFLSELTQKQELEPILQICMLKKVSSDKAKDRSDIEAQISQNLDNYIKKYADEMRQIPFTSLYNIFYHKERKLDDHEAAFTFITNNEQFEQTLSILLGSLDGSKLQRDSLKKAILDRDKHFGFIPTIDATFLENSDVNEKVTECKQKYEQEIQKLKEENDQTVKELTMKYEGEISQLKEKVQKLSQTVDEMTKKDDQKKKQLDLEKNGYKIECPFKTDELSGIFNFLNKNKYFEVNISGGGQTSEVHPITNLIKYDDENKNKYYFNYFNIVANMNCSYIEFDFGCNKIKLDSYTIRTNNYGYHPKSWQIIGRNNTNDEWDPIDDQKDISEMNGVYKQHHCKCNHKSSFYQYIRYVQLDSWTPNKPFNIYLTCIEFFGTILMESPPT